MADKRIPELDPKNVLAGDMMFIMYDPLTDTDYRVNLDQIIAGSSNITPWMPDPAVYNTGDLTLSDDKIWESQIDGNIDIPPTEGAEWKEVSKSLIPSGDLIIDKVAHGYAEGDWLTIKAGSWALCDEADIALGFVKDVIDADSFSFITKYERAQIIGVTPFQYYYHEDGGVVDAGPSDQIAYVAFDSDQVFMLTSSGGGGGNFWSLTGTSTLLGGVTIDGDGNDLIFANMAEITITANDSFHVSATESGSIDLYAENIGATEFARLSVSAFSGGSVFVDGRLATTGIEYFADYSAGYVDRSLVDKEYVDNAIGGAAYTFDNGLTLTGTVVKIGGLLVEPTTITTDVGGNDFFINGAGLTQIESDGGVTIQSNNFSVIQSSDTVNQIGVDSIGSGIFIATGPGGLQLFLPGVSPSDGDVLTYDFASGQALWAAAGGGGSGFWPLNGGGNAAGNISINGGGTHNVSIGVPGGLFNQLDLYGTRVRINGDPGYHSILGWDDTDNAIKHFVIGSGLAYNAATDTVSVATGLPYWPLSGFATLLGAVTINGASNSINWTSQGSWNITFASSGGLGMFTPSNAGLTISDFGDVIQNAADQTLLIQNFASNGNNANITDHTLFRKRNNVVNGANGIGMRVHMQNSSTTGTTYRSNVIESVLTIANPATSRGELRFGVAENAAFAIKLAIDEFGAKYMADYSANYTDRSLIDRGHLRSDRGQATEYTVATAPDPTVTPGKMIYVSDESGGACIAFSNGVNWKRIYDNAVIS